MAAAASDLIGRQLWRAKQNQPIRSRRDHFSRERENILPKFFPSLFIALDSISKEIDQSTEQFQILIGVIV